MQFSSFNTESVVTPSNLLWELAAKGIPLLEIISGFLVLSKTWDFPGLALKCFFLDQRESLVAEGCNSDSKLGISVAHEYGVVSSA